MTSPEIKVFAFVYHFICKTCKRINVGKKLYRAADIHDLPEKLSRTPFPCQYCGTWVGTHEETPNGYFSKLRKRKSSPQRFSLIPRTFCVINCRYDFLCRGAV
jgi:hypothetical protein